LAFADWRRPISSGLFEQGMATRLEDGMLGQGPLMRQTSGVAAAFSINLPGMNMVHCLGLSQHSCQWLYWQPWFLANLTHC